VLFTADYQLCVQTGQRRDENDDLDSIVQEATRIIALIDEAPVVDDDVEM
jgi:hypothetical protein